MVPKELGLLSLLATAILAVVATVRAEESSSAPVVIKGITGKVSAVSIAVPAAEQIALLESSDVPVDIDLRRMAAWAMNYLIQTPRKELNYEPVFQCTPTACPPAPVGHDVVAICDTDARMDWEWYYMREVSGSQLGKDVEAAFHKRMLGFVAPDGRVLAPPGAYNEAKTGAIYTKNDYVIHNWGATKILKSLCLDYERTKNPESKELAQKVMLALEKLATWDDRGRCYFTAGMGAFTQDGAAIPNLWNAEPSPVVESLVAYWLTFQDPEALKFARAYADGMMDNCQPTGIKDPFPVIQFQPDGTITGGYPYGPHSHTTMHAVWGVAHLGVVTGEQKYVDFARKIWDWMLTRGTGTGWFPAGPVFGVETCHVSDMMSTASLIARSGCPEYFDYVERYLRNYISPCQFLVDSEFEVYYRTVNQSAGEEQIQKGLEVDRKFQGGVIGGPGLNDYENKLLVGGGGVFGLPGCCAPEGMRAIYTTWSNVIDRLPNSPLGPAGVYVNLSLNRESRWGRVVSFMPDTGRLTVKAAVEDAFFLRPPHWADRTQVGAFLNAKSIPVQWSGDYVRFAAKPGDELTIVYPLVKFTHTVEGLWPGRAKDFPKAVDNLTMTFQWLGNMVTGSSPAGGRTPLFSARPRVLPPAPGE